jgi:hypothetical protein
MHGGTIFFARTIIYKFSFKTTIYYLLSSNSDVVKPTSEEAARLKDVEGM